MVDPARRIRRGQYYKTYVFFDEPQDKDLTDTAFGSRRLDLVDIDYCSEDSVQTDYEPISETMFRVYWKPKEGQVELGIPYRHQVASRFPGKPNPEYKCMTFPAPVRTRNLHLRITSEIPIDKVVAYRGTQRQSYVDVDKIAKRANTHMRRNAPVPTFEASKAEWFIPDMPAGSTYFVVVFFKWPADGGEHETVQSLPRA